MTILQDESLSTVLFELIFGKAKFFKEATFFVITFTYLIIQIQNGNGILKRVIQFLKCMKLAC